VERRQHDRGYEARAEEQVEMCQSANEPWNEHRLLSCEIEMADQLGDAVACALGGNEAGFDQLAEPLLGLKRPARRPQNERKETQTNERRENRTEGNKATNGATEEKRLEQNRATEERGRDNDRNRTTTGQGAAPNKGNVSVNITPEKRTQIHQVFIKERSAPRVDRVDFDLSVGTAVPRSVRFVAVPNTITAIEPSWRGYDYFMVGDQIVIVDPRSMEIVAIINA
jgi:Protein of unknown function (DUF1236)